MEGSLTGGSFARNIRPSATHAWANPCLGSGSHRWIPPTRVSHPIESRYLVGESREGVWKAVNRNHWDVSARASGDYGAEIAIDTRCPEFATIPEAIADIASGKFVVVLDDEDRENEGDLIMAGDKVTTEDMAFMVEHTSGVICTAMMGEDLDRLELPLMVNSAENRDAMRTAFTVTVDLADGITTGISASDRCKTIQKLSDQQSQARDFRRPGHIFPLKYEPGGVVVRPGHTEAAVDLSRLAGCSPVGVISEIVDKRDGSMARTPYLLKFAQQHGLKCITIAELVNYRMEHDAVLRSTGVVPIDVPQGPFKACCFQSLFDGSEYVAFVKGDVAGKLDVPVHVHTANFIDDAISSNLGSALQLLGNQDCGVVVYAIHDVKRALPALDSLLATMGINGDVEDLRLIDQKEKAALRQILHHLRVESVASHDGNRSNILIQQLVLSMDSAHISPKDCEASANLNGLCHNGAGSQ